MCWKGQEPKHGVRAYVDAVGGPRPSHLPSDRVRTGEWTCAVGEFEDGSRMVTLARWRDGAIVEEYIWA